MCSSRDQHMQAIIRGGGGGAGRGEHQLASKSGEIICCRMMLILDLHPSPLAVCDSLSWRHQSQQPAGVQERVFLRTLLHPYSGSLLQSICYVATDSWMVRLCCLMSSDVGWHIRDKPRPMPKHGSILLYVHGNHKLISTGSLGQPPRLSHSSWTMWLLDKIITGVTNTLPNSKWRTWSSNQHA